MAVAECVVIVEMLPVMARIGLHAHERGILQPLILTVRLLIAPPEIDSIEHTIDYREVQRHAEHLAGEHVTLIETFASRLAARCLEHSVVRSAEVVAVKPQALPEGVASTRVVLTRK